MKPNVNPPGSVRPASAADLPALVELFYQVHALHAEQRPDIFRVGERKYSDREILALCNDPEKIFLVWAEADGPVLGYGLGLLRDEGGPTGPLQARRTLYLDDLCVAAAARGRGIGEALYGALKAEARARGCVALTLNLWAGNGGAARFYERLGLQPLKTLLEEPLND